MMAEIRHRGPDAEGCWTEGRIGLAHTRLAIIDLQPESNQPFHSTDGRYVLVFNGEIFNYIELRSELEQLGHRFRTRSDTEVIVEAHRAWGDDCVPRFNGMWAYALYDREADRLFCSRDRFGIKPFVYSFKGATFLFGSEVKPLLAVCPELRRPDFTVVSHCLRRSLSGGLEDTCFDKVRRLLPAHNLVIDGDRVRFFRYWDYPRTADRRMRPGDAAEQVRSLLDDSVRLRMRSDVPVGITLSSGLDSTAIAHLMRNHSGDRLLAYTSAYESLESEVPVAGETSRTLGFEFHAVQCPAEGLVDRLRAIVRHIETPHAASPILPLWEIMRVARQGVKVVQEGQGSDELFAGYLPIYFSIAAAEALRRGRFLLAGRDLAEAWRVCRRQKQLGARYFWSNLLRTAIPGSHRLIRRYGRGDEDVYIGPLRTAPEYRLPVGTGYNDWLNQRLASAHSVELVDLLHYGDAISMAFGIESRLPFLDHRLVEAVFAMPGDLKFRNGITKFVLREAVAGTVPDSIAHNPYKQGFSTPVSEWFRQRPDDTVRAVLYSQACRERGLFDPQRVREIVEQHVSGQRDRGQIIFRWLISELWFQEFIDGRAA